MWYVYEINSVKFDFRYFGMSENPEMRLNSHNSGKVRFTKHYTPFKLVYTEVVKSTEEARKREKYLESAAGRKYLDKQLG